MRAWLYARRRRWWAPHRQRILIELVSAVLPAHAPFQHDTILSFLQPPGRGLVRGIRLDLFYPEYPLAIDVLGPEADADYRAAAPYISRAAWEALQADLAWKRRRLELYRCPYLVLTPADPSSLGWLRERVRLFTAAAIPPSFTDAASR